METLRIFVMIFVTFNFARGLPNFVILLADDLGYGDLGCFGNVTIQTPNIDKLAIKGIKLNHHLAAAAVCTPSRAALLTGRYPVRSGMESSNRNKVFFFAAASGGLPKNETTIAKALKIKNYSTALIGKWHLGNDCFQKGDGCHHPLNHGFDYFYGLPISNFKDLGDDGDSVITSYIPNFFSYFALLPVTGITLTLFTFKRKKYISLFSFLVLVILPIIVLIFLKKLKIVNGILMENMDVVEQPLRLKGLTQNIVDKANRFIFNQTSLKSPFFLFVSFVHVHTALFCSKDFYGKSSHGHYGDNVEELDWAVGQIVDTIERLDLINETFIYFSSDNGGHVEEYGVSGQREGGHNGILRGGKAMGGLEGGIRVPTIILWPDFPNRTESNVTTSQMDLFPTIMELAQIPLPKDRVIDGKTLIPILKSTLNQSQHRFLFHYCGRIIHAATFTDIKENKTWKIHWFTPKFMPGTQKCSYVCHCFGDFVVHHNPPLLFDLSKDVSESQPLNPKAYPSYNKIISQAETAKNEHLKTVDRVPDQFSFENTIWKPWLQPCCNFPLCHCRDPNFINVE